MSEHERLAVDLALEAKALQRAALSDIRFADKDRIVGLLERAAETLGPLTEPLCPFCGSAALAVEPQPFDGGVHSVKCGGPESCPLTGLHFTPEEWNRRAGPLSGDARREALEKALRWALPYAEANVLGAVNVYPESVRQLELAKRALASPGPSGEGGGT